ncbi:MAG: RNA methyltransferase [Erysipelotrichaceae bacterium]|nr:RNA methyltransferase [Erysipelotrichaceae bacterium]
MITSLDNKQVKELHRLLQKKYRSGSFLVTDEKMVDKAYDTGHLIRLVYTGDMPFPFDDSLEVSQEVLDKISEKEGLRYIGVSKMIEESRDYGNRVVILDQLQDPLNIARIMEACVLFGFDSIIMSDNCADIYNQKCLDNCKGTIYDLNLCHTDLIQEINRLKADGYKVYATGLSDNTKTLKEVSPSEKMAFIFGNEGSGVSREIMNASDEIIKIDMRNIDSLNVAMAASIVLYEFRTLL